MPWTGTSFQDHNHALHGARAIHAARIANATLRSGVPEGESIAIANQWAQRHRDAGGGIAADPGGGIAGIAPTAQNQSPVVQGQIQQYSSLPIEKLMELGARLGGSPQGALIQKLIAQRHVQPQAAPQTPTPGYAAGGGMMSSSEASPWWTRREAADESGGFLHGVTPGRADAVNTTAPGGSYIIPADVISGLGEGNSLAGAKVMDAILGSGPRGTPMPRGGGGGPRIRAPAPFHEQAAGGAVSLFPEKKAAGGVKSSGDTPVALSHGEYCVAPHHCLRIGRGDIKRGHAILDKWVIEKRKAIIDKMKKLKPPVGSKE